MSNLLKGGIDFHAHSSPSLFPRVQTDNEFAREADTMEMAAIVLKAHEGSTVERAFLAQQEVKTVKVFGGIVLNQPVGGLNPFAVETSLKMGGKVVWMPTMGASNHLTKWPEYTFPFKKSICNGLTVLNSDGMLKSEVINIMELVGEYDAVLATGHLSLEEVFQIAKMAKKISFKKVVLNHPELNIISATIEDQIQLAKMGVILEKCYVAMLPPFEDVTVEEMVEGIKKIGIEKCLLATDLGQKNNLNPVSGLNKFTKLLLENGLKRDEIKMMISENPKKLLNFSI